MKWQGSSNASIGLRMLQVVHRATTAAPHSKERLMATLNRLVALEKQAANTREWGGPGCHCSAGWLGQGDFPGPTLESVQSLSISPREGAP